MVVHEVRVHPSAARLPREAQLTWKLAELAAAAPPPEAAVAAMVACRVVDNAGVALAAINRQPVATARVMALAHPRPHGATLFGLPAAIRVQAEWACWANATAVRELDFHDCVSPGAHPANPANTSLPPVVPEADRGVRGQTPSWTPPGGRSPRWPWTPAGRGGRNLRVR